MRPGLLVLLGGTVAWVAWRAWYFGALLPLPYYVKAGVAEWMGIQEARAFAAEYALLLGVAALVSLACWVALVRRTGASAPPAEALAVVVVGVPWLLYSARILHDTGFRPRLSYPLVWLAGLGTAAGLRFLLDSVGERWPRALRAAAVVVALLGVGAAWPRVAAERAALRSPEPSDADDLEYRRLGATLGALGLGERLTLVTGLAGAIPYFSRARHVDPTGSSRTSSRAAIRPRSGSASSRPWRGTWARSRSRRPRPAPGAPTWTPSSVRLTSRSG